MAHLYSCHPEAKPKDLKSEINNRVTVYNTASFANNIGAILDAHEAAEKERTGNKEEPDA